MTQKRWPRVLWTGEHHGETFRLIRKRMASTMVERQTRDGMNDLCWLPPVTGNVEEIKDIAIIAIFGALVEAHNKLNPPAEVASPDDTGNVAE
tara:strand:- start:10377 stop:10655 length:279 start_codon:yes stop_codon:yes gene_type:complete